MVKIKPAVLPELLFPKGHYDAHTHEFGGVSRVWMADQSAFHLQNCGFSLTVVHPSHRYEKQGTGIRWPASIDRVYREA